MKKFLFFLSILMLVFVACNKEKNEPTGGNNSSTETPITKDTISSVTKDSVIPIIKDGALLGKFSVSDSTQVRFSQGNLQYQASTNTWRFAEHQYDTIGAFNRNISSTYAGWIDLFGWGTGTNPTLASTDIEDYATFTDWGVNAISNGGNKANAWRTLTDDEWRYLINGRANADSLRGQACVNGVNGYVLLPDGWKTPDGLHFTASPNNWTTNVYTLTEWTVIEALGAIFLPCAGSRTGTNVRVVGPYGDYWSVLFSYIMDYPSNFGFSEDYEHLFCNMRYCGYSVRLVQDL